VLVHIVKSEQEYYLATRNLQWRHTPRCVMHSIIVERLSYLVYGLHVVCVSGMGHWHTG